MKRLVAVGAALAALALAGCDDGYRPVEKAPEGISLFYIYDDQGQEFDYGMAQRACESVDQYVGPVQELPDAAGIVTCIGDKP